MQLLPERSGGCNHLYSSFLFVSHSSLHLKRESILSICARTYSRRGQLLIRFLNALALATVRLGGVLYRG